MKAEKKKRKARLLPGLAVKDGFIEVPDRPGLGTDLIEEVALTHPYQDQFTLRLYEKDWERRGD